MVWDFRASHPTRRALTSMSSQGHFAGGGGSGPGREVAPAGPRRRAGARRPLAGELAAQGRGAPPKGTVCSYGL